MKILSIDHSFNRTGYAIMEDYKLICTGNFHLGGMSYENVLKFDNNINELIEKFRPEIVITEKPAHMRNVNIARMLTSLHTVIILASMRAGIPVHTSNPKTSKKVVTGNGSATKEDVCNALMSIYGYSEDMLCEKIYYKNNKTKIKKIEYDESDAVSNAIEFLNLKEKQ